MSIKLVRIGQVEQGISHRYLLDLEYEDQHPIDAITGLRDHTDRTEIFMGSLLHVLSIGDSPYVKEYSGCYSEDGKAYIEADPLSPEAAFHWPLATLFNTAEQTLPGMIKRTSTDRFMSIHLPSAVSSVTDATVNQIFKEYGDLTKTVTAYVSDQMSISVPSEKEVSAFIYNNVTERVLLNIDFHKRTFIKRFKLNITNVNCNVYMETVDGVIALLGSFRSTNPSDIYSFTANSYVKRLFVKANEDYEESDEWTGNIEYIFAGFTAASIYKGSFTYIRGIGKTIDNTEEILVRPGNDYDPYISFVSGNYSSDTNLTSLVFKIEKESSFPIVFPEFYMSYVIDLDDTIMGANEHISQVNDAILSLQNEFHDFLSDAENTGSSLADLLNLIQTLKVDLNEDITNLSDLTNEVNAATQGVNELNIPFSTLKERMDYIERKTNSKVNNFNELLTFNPIHRVIFKVVNADEVLPDTEKVKYIVGPVSHFELPFQYPFGFGLLQVYTEGALAEEGADEDYIEATNSSIQFNYDIEPGEEVGVILLTTVHLTTKMVNEVYTYNPDGTTATIERSGDINETVTFTYNGDEITETITTINGDIVTVYNNNVDGKPETILNKVYPCLKEVEVMIPKVIKIREQMSLAPFEVGTLSIDLPGVNQFEIKSIYVESDVENVFAVHIQETDQADSFKVYSNREVYSKLYDLIPVVYFDETSSNKLHLRLENLLNKSSNYTIRIDGTELRV